MSQFTQTPQPYVSSEFILSSVSDGVTGAKSGSGWKHTLPPTQHYLFSTTYYIYILVGECSAFLASGSDPTVLFTILTEMIQ